MLPFRPGRDEEAWLRVNARAFDWHPEQGRMTAADLELREAEPWFDPAGFLMAWRGDPDAGGTLLGSHWTKVHPAGDAGPEPVGEVYVLGIDPDAQGLRLGGALTDLGLAHLRGTGWARSCSTSRRTTPPPCGCTRAAVSAGSPSTSRGDATPPDERRSAEDRDPASGRDEDRRAPSHERTGPPASPIRRRRGQPGELIDLAQWRLAPCPTRTPTRTGTTTGTSSGRTAGAVETWREGYPYDERMHRARVRDRQAAAADRAAQAAELGQGHRPASW